MPIILGAIGLGLGAVGTGASLYSQNQAKKAAKRAEEENRRTAAWNALMQAAAGGVPQNNFQASAMPQVDYGGAVSQLGSGLVQAGSLMADRDYKNQLLTMKARQAAEANAQEDRRIKVAETTAANTAEYQKGMLDNAWQARMGRDLDRMNQFEADERAADDLKAWREKQYNLEKDKIAAIANRRGITSTLPPDNQWLVRDEDSGGLAEWDEKLGVYKPKLVDGGTDIKAGSVTLHKGGVTLPSKLRKLRNGALLDESGDDPGGLLEWVR